MQKYFEVAKNQKVERLSWKHCKPKKFFKKFKSVGKSPRNLQLARAKALERYK